MSIQKPRKIQRRIRNKKKMCADVWDTHIREESHIAALQPPLITFVRISYLSAPLLSCSTAVSKLKQTHQQTHTPPYTYDPKILWGTYCSNSSSLNFLIVSNNPFNSPSSSPLFTKSFNSGSLNISNNTLTWSL